LRRAAKCKKRLDSVGNEGEVTTGEGAPILIATKLGSSACLIIVGMMLFRFAGARPCKSTESGETRGPGAERCGVQMPRGNHRPNEIQLTSGLRDDRTNCIEIEESPSRRQETFTRIDHASIREIVL
jgi:hypothetical protein